MINLKILEAKNYDLGVVFSILKKYIILGK
jgi:hypothetical protein